jgi:16S rRNA (guanine966-N2)-methyltransferase
MDNAGRKMEFYAAACRTIARALPRSAANAVRIIGGRCRGRLVRFPANAALRPTPDRVRETLFNWLGQDLTGRSTLELYAGSGVLSLEALSRGAALAVAVDRVPGLVSALRQNAALLGLAGLEAARADARAFVARETREFDVIFLDPPFADDPWGWLLPACAERLAAGGLVYVEAGRHLAAPPALEPVRTARAGQVYYHLLTLR